MHARTPYKLLLFDLDGTLLLPERKISDESLQTLRDLMSRGVRVGLATGRSRRSVEPYVQTLKPNGPLILFNGAHVWDSLTNRRVNAIHLPAAEAFIAMELVREFDDLHVNFYVNDEILISHKSDRSRESEIKDGVPHTVVGDLADWLMDHPGTSPVKIMLISEPPTLEAFRAKFLQRATQPCSLIRSEWNYLEIMHEGINKGAALPIVEREFGIARNEIISFGDNLNDLDLIRLSGLGVAMGNAHEELKAIASRIIGSHEIPGSIPKFLNEVFPHI